MTAVTQPRAFVLDPVRPPRYSMSFIRAAGQCLRRAHYEREDDVTGADAIIGHVFHEIAAAVGWATVLRGQRTPDYVEVERIARRVLSRPEEFDPLSKHVWDEVLFLVGKWMLTAEFEPDEQFELSMRHKIRGRVISARIDRLRIDREARVAHVLDYKSGRADPPPRPEPTPQGDIYAWEVLQAHPWLVGVWFATAHARFGHAPQWYFYSREEIAQVGEWLFDQVGRIDAAYAAGGELPANPGDACSLYDGCPVADTCPVKAWARPATVTRSPEDALAEFAKLMAEEQSIKNRKAAIRSWVEREAILALVTSDDQALEQFGALLVEEATVAERKKRIRGFVTRAGVRAVQLNGQELGYGTDAGTETDWKGIAETANPDESTLATFTKPKNPSFGRRKAKEGV